MGNYIYPFPAGTRVTQNYGSNPNNGYNPRGGHIGKDFGVPIGTPVWAPCDGVIAFEGWVTGQYYENPWWLVPQIAVVVDAGPGKPAFVLGHLNETMVNKGDRVRKGQIIAKSGNTGPSTGPHLHLDYLPDNWDYQNGTYGRLNPDSICEYWDGTTVQPAGNTKPAIPEEDPTHWAIDISNHQGDINISAINPDRVIIRASEGVGGADAWLEASARKARIAGKAVDFYHFSHIGELDGNTAAAEAEWFLSQVRKLWRPGDHIVLDWEARYSQLWNGAAARDWMDQVLADLGADPEAAVFYSNYTILTDNSTGLRLYREKYPQLWLAWYGTETLNTWGDPALVYGPPPVPAGWELWGWQYSQYGRVPGYNGNLDLNIIYGGTEMPSADEIVHALLTWPIGDAYNGEAGRPKVTVSDLLIKLWQLDVEGVSKVRPAGALVLIREDIAALAATINTAPAPQPDQGSTGPAPTPAPELARKYRLELVEEEPTP